MKRRIGTLLLGIMLLMANCSYALTPDEDLDSTVNNMSLEEKVGQMFMPSLRMWDNVTEVTDEIKETIKRYHLGGIILFAENIETAEQTSTLIKDLQEAADIPLLISADQEGGIVNRIKFGTKFPGNMALGATNASKYAYKVGKSIGEELKALGINVNLAPVLDVNINPDNPVIGVRSFGEDPDLVSEMGVSYIKGLHDAGIAATAKHFPGHGDTDVDSHIGLPKVPHDIDRLKKVELKPFQNAIEAGVDMIMTAHVVLPAIDDTEPSLPATLSHKVLTGLLREDMGFDGVIITDALEMKAIADNFGPEESVIRAVKAGTDIVLMPTNLDKAYNAVLDAVKTGEISEERINESVKRILKLKISRGIYNSTSDNNENKNKNKDLTKIVGSNKHKALERNVARKAVTLVKNDNNLLPFKLEKGKKIVLLAPWQNRLDIMKDALNKIIEDKGVKNVEVEGFAYTGLNKLTDEHKKAIDSADYIVLGSYSYNVTSRTPGKYWVPNYVLDTVKYANENDKNLAVMAIRNPYDIMYMPDVKAYIAVYGRAEGPNIPAGIEVIFGEVEPKGQLPVSIPTMDGSGILYKMGHGLSYE
ncbi:beta-N-acetylhexosaminidase [Thermohalobacter berrensis]|uniref:beta-N-acetylhexosaminidase n=1 Tax=Thermohalobacter berrensis TaxID=99594 RepID=A0A419T482_9FIRM|nr:beta-N-acetylhexosaminidase [Thermohalobacter berrensis]RKD32255.1 hypothetical protein BET03_02785 [Thermohalobacter berrensis]